ncbi:peptidoglycan recognition protein family protein, partial [Enterococcus faecium]
FAYTINNEFNLGANEGSSQIANNQYILLHETANETATGRNEAQYMQRSWTSAYTAYIVGDGGIVYQVGQPGYVQYGAGSYANANSPVQIELQHTHDKATFEKNYKAYVELARDSAMKYGIPLTLDTPYNQPGIKSHLWVTQNIWGDHTDPYGYLSEMGVSKEKLAYDLAHGFTDENPTTSENK